MACVGGRTACVRLFLKDPRVNLNECHSGGFTPLREAASSNHLEIVQWWIASGRDMDLGEPGDDKTDAIKVATSSGSHDVASLLQRFRENPEETRQAVRRELGI